MDNSIGSSKSFTGISYFFAIPLVVVVIVAIAALGSYYYRVLRGRSADPQGNLLAGAEIGLDETILQSYPTLLYSKAKLEKKNITSCCSICLSDYNNTEILRLVPECGHLFHVECIDPWFQRHSTCPVCRSTPIIVPILLQT